MIKQVKGVCVVCGLNGKQSSDEAESVQVREKQSSASQYLGSAGGRISETAGEEVERVKAARGRGPPGSRGGIATGDCIR